MHACDVTAKLCSLLLKVLSIYGKIKKKNYSPRTLPGARNIYRLAPAGGPAACSPSVCLREILLAAGSTGRSAAQDLSQTHPIPVVLKVFFTVLFLASVRYP